MKRQIKFRGKRTDTGEWIYGDLLTSNGTECEISDWNDVVYSRYDVDPDTVGQFTGLLDKNGKEIYEGDILSMDCFKTDLGQYAKRMVVSYEVKDYNDGTQWSWFNLTNIEDDTEYAFFRSKKMTVIGNIHDNPELLKGGKP